MTKSIKIEGMSCGHCSAAVKKELEKIAGVSKVNVDLDAKQATLEAEAPVSDEMLRAAVDEAGYEVVGIQ